MLAPTQQAGGWAARPKVCEDELAGVLRLCFDSFLEEGRSFQRDECVIKLQPDEVTGFDAINLASVDLNYDILERVYSSSPHSPPAPSVVKAAWQRAAQSMTLNELLRFMFQ